MQLHATTIDGKTFVSDELIEKGVTEAEAMKEINALCTSLGELVSLTIYSGDAPIYFNPRHIIRVEVL